MKNIENIKNILIKILELLKLGDYFDWLGVFHELNENILIYPKDIIFKIKFLYGGMGSFNDIVLYKNQQLLIKENNELDFLRKELYKLCKENNFEL